MKRSGIERRSGLTRTTRLRPRSARTSDVYANERRPLVARLLSERPRCEAQVVCTGARSVDIHEILPRGRGGSIVDEMNVLAVCRACHTYVDDHDSEARCAGLSLPQWAGNVADDPIAEAAKLRNGDRGPCLWRDLTRPCPSTDLDQRDRCESQCR